MKHLLALALLMAAGLARADFEANRLWLNAGFYSAHFDTGKGLRNANPGIGAEYKLDGPWSLTAGRFINSNDQYSSYVGAPTTSPGLWPVPNWALWAAPSMATPRPSTAAGFQR